MNTETLTAVIADVVASAIRPLRQELSDVTPTAAAQPQEDEPNWEMFDRAAEKLNLIVKH